MQSSVVSIGADRIRHLFAAEHIASVLRPHWFVLVRKAEVSDTNYIYIDIYFRLVRHG